MSNTPIPHCPFCDAPWTQDMLDMFDRYTVEGGCACCGGETPEAAERGALVELATEDICCTSCGKAIYRAPKISAQAHVHS